MLTPPLRCAPTSTLWTPVSAPGSTFPLRSRTGQGKVRKWPRIQKPRIRWKPPISSENT